jgi:hypothetical protein
MNHTEPMQVLFVEMQKSVAQNVLLKLWRLPREDIVWPLCLCEIHEGKWSIFYTYTHMFGTLTITASFQKC